MVRKRSGRRSQPTAAILDSQSVKSDPHCGPVGYDGGKKIKGRKRHMLVDVMGLIIGIWVTEADLPEREGGIGVIGGFCHCLRWLRKIFVDGGYSGPEFADGVRDIRPLANVEVVRRLESQKGFKVLHKRWIVERTFGWLMRHRRLVRDYECTTRNAEAFALIAMIRIQLRRLA